MKKFLFPLFAALLFAACQNSTPAPAADTQNVPAELKIDPVQVKEANAKAKTSLQNMHGLLDELNAVTIESKKTEMTEMRQLVNDIISKQEMMQKALEIAENAGGADANALNSAAVPPPGVLQDYIQSAGSYDKLVEEVRVRFEAAKSSSASGN